MSFSNEEYDDEFDDDYENCDSRQSTISYRSHVGRFGTPDITSHTFTAGRQENHSVSNVVAHSNYGSSSGSLGWRPNGIQSSDYLSILVGSSSDSDTQEFPTAPTKHKPLPAIPKQKNVTLALHKTPNQNADKPVTGRNLDRHVGPAAHGGHQSSGLQNVKGANITTRNAQQLQSTSADPADRCSASGVNQTHKVYGIEKEQIRHSQLQGNNHQQQPALKSSNTDNKHIATTPLGPLASKLQEALKVRCKSSVDGQSTTGNHTDTADRTGELRMIGKAKGPSHGRVDRSQQSTGYTEVAPFDRPSLPTNSGNIDTLNSRPHATPNVTVAEPGQSHANDFQPSSHVATAASMLSLQDHIRRKPPAPPPTENMFHSTLALTTVPPAPQPESSRPRSDGIVVPLKPTDGHTSPIRSPPPPLTKPLPSPKHVKADNRKQPATKGKVSSTSKELRENLHQFTWYFEGLTRHEAEKRIRSAGKNGVFVIRKTDQPSCPDHRFSMSLLYEKQPYHMVIRCRLRDGKFALGTEKIAEPVFDSLPELVTFYTNNFVEILLHANQDDGSTSTAKVRLVIVRTT